MMTISLKDLQFRAFHGIHEEEKILGNEYIVSCSVGFQVPGNTITHIDDTVNYQSLFELISQEMKVATPLLETLCINIEQAIHNRFPQIASCEIVISKLRPPVAGFTGSSAVTWEKNYETTVKN